MADGQSMDRRALLGIGSGAAGLALGASAVAFGSAVVGVIAAVFALAAAAACILVTSQLREQDTATESLRREIVQLEDALLAEREAFESAAEMAAPPDPAPIPEVRDNETGLLGEHYFELALEHRIATARRQLQPVALLLLSLDASQGSDSMAEDRQQRAVYAFASILSETLRESDTVCRLSATNFGVILEDTSEAGGVWAAERLRTGLVRDGMPNVRLAAGVAAYPTHALESADVLTRAQAALDSARRSGSSRVEVASAE
jgi:diguanylate cyclase (GGDEF)-like protein